MKMIAKTIAGKEYIYSKSSAHAVSNAEAKPICDALNKARYDLKDGEAWHIYDLGWYENEFTNAGVMKFTRRKGKIYEARI